MSKFENRESQTLNYKILDVKSVERDESSNKEINGISTRKKNSTWWKYCITLDDG